MCDVGVVVGRGWRLHLNATVAAAGLKVLKPRFVVLDVKSCKHCLLRALRNIKRLFVGQKRKVFATEGGSPVDLVRQLPYSCIR